MEYMNYGSLTYLIHTNVKIPESVIAYVCKEVLLALRALQKNNEIHRGMSLSSRMRWVRGAVLGSGMAETSAWV